MADPIHPVYVRTADGWQQLAYQGPAGPPGPPGEGDPGGQHLEGSHAARPDPTTVPNDTLYACSTHDLIYISTAGGATALSLGPQERMLADTPVPDQSGSGDYTLGSEFTVLADGIITAIRYYHGYHLGAHTHALGVWDVLTGTKLAGVIDTPPPGEPAGWREVAFAEPLSVYNSVTYRSSYSADSLTMLWWIGGPPASLAVHLDESSIGAAYYGVGRDSFPVNAQTGYTRPADVVYQMGAPDVEGWATWAELGGGDGGGVYHHIQSAASTTWTVDHALGRHPVVSVLDSAGSQVEVDVSHVSVDQLVLTLAYAVSGTADCS